MTFRIKSPSLYQIIYILSWHALESKSEFEWHQAAIKDFLFAAWKKANPLKEFPEEKLKDYSRHAQKLITAHETPLELFSDIRLLSTEGWVKVETMSQELDVRSYDDTVRIHLTNLIEGEKNLEIFNQLRNNIIKTNELVKTEGGKHAYIGEVYYPVAEIKKSKKVKIKEIAAEILEIFGVNPETEFDILECDWGYFILSSERKEMPVILYKDIKETKPLVVKLVHRILPYIFLNRCKFKYVLELSKKLRSKIEDGEKEVSNLSLRSLSGLTSSSSRGSIKILRKMEEEAIELSKAQGLFIQELTNLKGFVGELDVIFESLNKLLERKIFNQHETVLKTFWTRDIGFIRAQLETNLRFYTLTKESSDSALNSLSKIAQIRDTEWDRVTNFLIGILAVWAILDVFETDIKPWYLRLLIMFGLGYLFYRILPKFRDWLKI